MNQLNKTLQTPTRVPPAAGAPVAPPPCVEKIEIFRRSMSSMSSIDLPSDFPRVLPPDLNFEE